VSGDFATQSLEGLIAGGKTFAGIRRFSAGREQGVRPGICAEHNPAAICGCASGSNRPMSDFPAANWQVAGGEFCGSNLVHDMHDGRSRPRIAGWRIIWGAMLRWAKRKNSLLIVTWDEDDGSSSNHIATIFFGAHVKSGKYLQKINHFMC